MRKRLITPTQESIRTHGEGWSDVERAAVVEITSEDKDFPSSPLSAREKGRVGALQGRGAKRFAWSSISRKSLGAYPWCLKKMKLLVRRSSFCDGLRMAEAR
jgi:hypothetical protein